MRAPGPLRVDGLEVRYGDLVAVRPTTFLVPPGGMLAVTGPSGQSPPRVVIATSLA